MENQFLYRSLTQDLRSLNNLAKTMMSNGSAEIYSWLDPRKTFSELDDISSFYVYDETGRMKCMELIIDRLYMILNLNIEYLEMPFRLKTKLQKNVGKPKNLTLGLSASLLWDRIQQLILDTNICKLEPTEKYVTNFTNTNQTFENKYVQVSSEMKPCVACQIAQDCIRLIANELSRQKQDENITRAKKSIQDNIYEVTQITSMNVLAKAIRSDIGNMIKDNKELELQVKDHKQMYQFLNYNYQDSLKRNEELLVKIQELEKLEQEHLESVGILQAKTNKLQFEKHQQEKMFQNDKEKFQDLQTRIKKSNEIIEELRFEIDTLQKKIDIVTEQTETVTAEKELWKIRFSDAHAESKRLQSINEESRTTVDKLESELKDAIGSVADMSKEIQKMWHESDGNSEKELWKTRCTDAQNENEKLQSLNEDLKNIVNKLEHELDLAASHFKELDVRITRNYDEIDNNAKAYVELLKRTQEVVEANDKLANQLEGNLIMSNTTGGDLEVHGDPLYDMMKQVEINKSNMQKLEHQNSMLMSTIRKVRLRPPKSINSNK